MALKIDSIPEKSLDKEPIGECRLDEEGKGYFHKFTDEEKAAKGWGVPEKPKEEKKPSFKGKKKK